MSAHDFRAEHVTEGKIAVDEDRSTPVFSPYIGRLIQLMAEPGDQVEKGQPLFVIEAADTVQAQNDFISAMTSLNKARPGAVAGCCAKYLYEGRAVPLKDYQQSQANLIQAQNNMRSSQTALEAARNKLKIGSQPAAVVLGVCENEGAENATMATIATRSLFMAVHQLLCVRYRTKNE